MTDVVGWSWCGAAILSEGQVTEPLVPTELEPSDVADRLNRLSSGTPSVEADALSVEHGVRIERMPRPPFEIGISVPGEWARMRDAVAFTLVDPH